MRDLESWGNILSHCWDWEHGTFYMGSKHLLSSRKDYGKILFRIKSNYISIPLPPGHSPSLISPNLRSRGLWIILFPTNLHSFKIRVISMIMTFGINLYSKDRKSHFYLCPIYFKLETIFLPQIQEPILKKLWCLHLSINQELKWRNTEFVLCVFWSLTTSVTEVLGKEIQHRHFSGFCYLPTYVFYFYFFGFLI